MQIECLSNGFSELMKYVSSVAGEQDGYYFQGQNNIQL